MSNDHPNLRVTSRTWNGVDVVVSEIRADTGLFLATGSATHAKIAIALEHVGGPCETRLQDERGPRATQGPHTVHYVPAGVATLCVNPRLRRLRHVALMIQPHAVPHELTEILARGWPDEPLIGLSSKPMVTLGGLLADEVHAKAPASDLYGDGLVLAIIAELSRVSKSERPSVEAQILSRAQLSRVIEYMEDNFSERIELQSLASLVGFSQSHFCHAFKSATGLPPYRYYLRAKVKRAQQKMVSDRGVAIADVARDFGFADQSHFTRVFREFVGVSPGQWRRQLDPSAVNGRAAAAKPTSGRTS